MTTNQDEAIRWLEGATVNFFRATEAAKTEDYPQAVLLLQQCLEFTLKAILLARGVIPHRTHDPGPLLRKILPKEKIKEFTEVLELMSELVAHYLPTRYPERISPFEIYTEEDWDSYRLRVANSLSVCIEELSDFLYLQQKDLLEKALTPLKKSLRKKVQEVLITYELGQ